MLLPLLAANAIAADFSFDPLPESWLNLVGVAEACEAATACPSSAPEVARFCWDIERAREGDGHLETTIPTRAAMKEAAERVTCEGLHLVLQEGQVGLAGGAAPPGEVAWVLRADGGQARVVRGGTRLALPDPSPRSVRLEVNGQPVASLALTSRLAELGSLTGEVDLTSDQRPGGFVIPSLVRPGASSLATSTANYLVQRAEEELAAWLAEDFVAEDCRSEGGELFPETCGLLKRDVHFALGPGSVALQAAARRDLQAFPRRQLQHAVDGTDSRDPAHPALMTAGPVARAMELSAHGVPAELALAGWSQTGDFAGIPCEPTPSGVLWSLSLWMAALPTSPGGLLYPGPAARDWAFEQVNVSTLVMIGEGAYPQCGIVAEDRSLSVSLALADKRLETLIDLLDRQQRLARMLQSTDLPADLRLAARGELAAMPVAFGERAVTAAAGADPAVLDATTRLLEPLRTLAEGAVSPIPGESLLAVFDLVNTLADLGVEEPPTPERVRLITFVALLAHAQPGVVAADILHDVLVPAGGYSRKRDVPTLGLNAYVGVGGGAELAAHLPSSAAVWPAVLLGPEANIPVGKASLGLFISVLDLGAVATWRFDYEGFEGTDKPSLQHLFSPGAFLMFGLPKAPVALGFGASSTHALRVDGDGNSVDTVRAGGFLAVDLPLLR